jgi:hypothetical protein
MRLNLPHLHLRNIGGDSVVYVGHLRRFPERFELPLSVLRVLETTNPDKFVLATVNPGSQDWQADSLVERYDHFLENLQEVIHRAFVYGVKSNLS